MRPTLISAIAAAMLSLAGGAKAQELRIGLSAPLSGDAALLGEQMRAGARQAAAAAGMEDRLVVADDSCSPEGGADAARDLLDKGADIVIGYLCTEAIEAALPILTEAGVPVITSGVRTDGLTDRKYRTGWLVFRLAPRTDNERAAVADIFTERWRDELFAIVDDGTIYGRELAEALRFAAEESGLSPVFLDTFRPQMDNQIALAGRLDRAGATHVFVGGDRPDIAIIARDAAELEVPLTIAGGSALRAEPGEVPLAEGVLMVGLRDWAADADARVLARLEDAGIVPEGYVLPTYAAFDVAAAVLEAARAGAEDLAGMVGSRRFDTAIGPVSFDEKGDLSVNPYRLFVYDGDEFVPAE